MRHAFKTVSAIILICALSLSMSAAPREEPGRSRREKQNPIMKVIKKIFGSLGDGLHIPIP